MRVARQILYGDLTPYSADEARWEFVEWRFPQRAALERCRAEFMYVRSELAELKRTGSRHKLGQLRSEHAKLSSEIERLEKLLMHRG
jgi:hypothetical protein